MQNAKTTIPDVVRNTVADVLKRYGINFEALLVPEGGGSSESRGRFLSVTDVERKYGIRRWTLRRLINAGKIGASKLASAKPGKVLVDCLSLERYLKSVKVGGKNKQEKGER